MDSSVAQTIAQALGGHRAGNGWMARCPAHDDSTPSLSVKETADGKLLVHCHAGCAQSVVIDSLQARGLWHRLGAIASRDSRVSTRHTSPAEDRLPKRQYSQTR